MGAFDLMHEAVDGLRELPGVKQLRRTAFDRRFARADSSHLFKGVFDTADAALAACPPVLPVGFDNEVSAEMYVDRLQIDDYDHPALFWLAGAIHQGMNRITDFGGSVGIKYFAFRKLMEFPPELRWRVIDVPAVARRGRAFAAEHGASAVLDFSDQVADADGMDVVYASGSLQFMPQSLPEMLQSFRTKPARIVVNTTPIHEHHSFFTLHHSGTGYCPYRVQARDAFVKGVEAQGYRLRDQWRNIGKRMELTHEPGYSVEHYSGFCFDACS